MKCLTWSVVCAGVLAASVSASPTRAVTLTGDIAKKCDTAAFQAFPNQRVGTKLGTAQRAKFRKDCAASGGDMPNATAASNTAPATSPPK